MNFWQTRASEKMKNFLRNFSEIENVSMIGSMNEQNSLDIFSDIDLEIHLNSSEFDLKKFINAMSTQVNTVFGYEIIGNDNCDTLRVCFENGWRFDLIFLYPDAKKFSKDDTSFSAKVDTLINQFWFIAFLALVKLGLNDYLIAAHLALELFQLNIVLQMLIRDFEKNTNVHRFGDKESVPVLQHFSSRDTEIINMLFHAADDTPLTMYEKFSLFQQLLYFLLGLS
jgi:predicted nucleotidyltransferase